MEAHIAGSLPRLTAEAHHHTAPKERNWRLPVQWSWFLLGWEQDSSQASLLIPLGNSGIPWLVDAVL